MKLITIFLLTFISYTVYSQSAWQWVNPYPTGNAVRDIKYFNDSEIYIIGDKGSIYKSINGGNNWSDKSKNIQQSFTDIFFLNNSTGYILSTNGLIFRTVNAGESWNPMNSGITDETYSIEFTNEQTGYITSTWGKIFKTTNGGSNWFIQNTKTIYFWKASHFINSFTGFCIGANKIAKTINGGSNWTLEDVSPNAILRTIIFLDDNTGLAAGENGIIFKTTNSGGNWNIVPTNFQGNINKLMFHEPETYIAVTDSGKIYKSPDSGNTWFLKLAIPGNFTSIGKNNNSFIATGFRQTWNMNHGMYDYHSILYKSSNSGEEWFPLGSNFDDKVNLSVRFINQNTGFIVGDSGKVLKTSNGGDSWSSISFPGDKPLTSIYFQSENTGYITSSNIFLASYGIYRSTNSGNNWTEYFPVPDPDFKIYSIYFKNNLTGFITGSSPSSDESIYGTTDGGVIWTPVNLGHNQITIFSVGFMNEQTGFVSGMNSSFYGVLLRTTNGGINWLHLPVYESLLDKIKILNDSTGYIRYGSKLLKSTNRGNVWYQITPSPGMSIIDYDFISPDSGYVSGSDGVLLRTIDGGLQWNTLHIINNTAKGIYFINSRTGFITGNAGMILKTNSFGINVGISQFPENIPSGFYLSQNYPNPFNPVTNINFGLNKSGHVLLKIFDINGKQVEILKNEFMPQGRHIIAWNASKYASGIYFYSVQFENKIQTKKMILIK